MRDSISLLIVVVLTFTSCHSEMSQQGKLVEEVNQKVSKIDHNHRVQIIETDHPIDGSTWKVRQYISNNERVKVVAVVMNAHYERDDYFYFDGGEKIFSGHMINFRDERLAEEFKYYFKDGKLVRSYMWKDHYTPGKRFPHEQFELFEPNMDSLINEEEERLAFLLELLKKDGREIKSENENLGANN